jgi:hypothetical protein
MLRNFVAFVFLNGNRLSQHENTSQYEFIWNPRSASLRIICGSTLRRLQAQFLNAYSTLPFPPPALQPPIALPIFSRSSAVGSHFTPAHGLSHFSKCASRRLSISFFMSFMSVNRPQRVTSQFLGAPSISTINSSTSPRWSRYFSRRCCLQMSAVCCCRLLDS